MTVRSRRTCGILSAFLGSLLMLAIIVGYSQYLSLKETLINRISEKASSMIGQKVEISDIHLDTGSGITVTGLRIRNPEGFPEGDLFAVRSIRLGIRYRALFSGIFSFRTIGIDTPVLSLRRDKDNRLNLSDGLISFLSQKGTARYQVDRLLIENGQLHFDDDPHHSVTSMKAVLENLSSEAGARTAVHASLLLAGNNRIEAEGWAFLKDPARKFNMTIDTEMSDLAALAQTLAPYGIEIEKSRASIHLQADGDLKEGIRLRTDARLKRAGLFLLRNAAREISFTSEGFFDPGADSLVIKNVLLAVGDASSLQMTGVVHALLKEPTYAAEIRINDLDLSAFTFMKGLQTGGRITSGPIRLKGRLAATLPDADGTVRLIGVFCKTSALDAGAINAAITFSLGRSITADLEGTAEIRKAGTMAFAAPAAVKLHLQAKGTREKASFTGELSTAGLDALLNGKRLTAASAAASVTGILQGGKARGTALATSGSLQYESFRASSVKVSTDFAGDARAALLSGLKLESDIALVSADRITLSRPRKTGQVDIELKNLSASYPGQDAAITGMNGTAHLLTGGQAPAGNMAFALREAAYKGIRTGTISGRGSLDAMAFSLDIPSAELFSGRAAFSARGAVRQGPFPISFSVSAENIDLGPAVQGASLFLPVPYTASGRMTRMNFSGTALARDRITGKALMESEKFSVLRPDKRALLRDAAIHAAASFREQDLDFSGDLAAGPVKISGRGSVASFAGPARTVSATVSMPETGLGDIRLAFWDMVPDSMLYAGADGTVALQLVAHSDQNGASADGTALIRDILLEGENGEFTIGPVNGMIPIHFNSSGPAASFVLAGFDREHYDQVRDSFTAQRHFSGNQVTIGKFRYGFRLLEDISLWVELKGKALTISHLSAKMFEGDLYGAAAVDLYPKPGYRAGVVVDGISLTRLCEDITPIRGYISGKVDGIMALMGTDAGISGLIGKMDFWTYADKTERTRISREFLEKIGGPQVRAYLGERKFDRGIMSAYLQNGYLVFRALEISNRNFFGMTDLSVKVAPLNNRISIDHLMWTIVEAAQRAKK